MQGCEFQLFKTRQREQVSSCQLIQRQEPVVEYDNSSIFDVVTAVVPSGTLGLAGTACLVGEMCMYVE